MLNSKFFSQRVSRSFIVLLLMLPVLSYAQDGFGFDDSGFGFADTEASGFRVKIGGLARAELAVFYDDFDSAERIKNIRLGDIFSGRLDFEASTQAAEAIINVKLRPVFDGSSPLEIDEAYLRAYFGNVTLLGGLKKLTWGKADSFGPLDVVNPLDYTDLTKLIDPESVKIARPLVHASLSMGTFTKLEAVFVPWFQGHKFDLSGRWAPGEIKNMAPNLVSGLKTSMSGINPGLAAFFPSLDNWQNNFQIENYYNDKNYTLEYAQGGMRLSSTIGSTDFGFQYYFGRHYRPGVTIGIDDYILGLQNNPSQSSPDDIAINVIYSYYHQIAADFAKVIAGFNIRAEAGANLTSDLDGTDGSVHNHALVWSLGFDRDLFSGINFNLQGGGKFILFHNKIGDNFIDDIEAGSSVTSTRLTGIVSKKFLRDELETKATFLWGIEDRDFLFIPALIWSRNDLKAEAMFGIFGGDREGELGQYRDSSFFKLCLSYYF